MTEEEITAMCDGLAFEACMGIVAKVEQLTGVKLGFRRVAAFGVIARSPVPPDLAEAADGLLAGAQAELDQAQAELRDARRKSG